MKKLSLNIIGVVTLLSLAGCNKTNSNSHTNFDKAEEFQITEDSVAELNTKFQEVAKETALAMDNVNGKITVKDTNFDYKSESKERVEDVIETTPSSVQISNLNSVLELGVKGVYSAKDKSGFMAYAELKDVSGSLKFSHTDKDNKTTNGAYSLLDNTMEFYHYDATEYIHISSGLKNTVFGILKKSVPADELASVVAAEAMIPKNGKLSVSGIADNIEYPIAEKPGDDFEVEDLDIDSLLKLQNTAMENGYELKDIVSFKVSSNKSHYLSIQVSMDKQMLTNAKDLMDKVGKENVDLPIDVDLETTEFDNYSMTVETDAKKRINYATVKFEGLNINNVDELEEDSYYASSTYVKDTNLNLEATLDYDSDVAKRIPNKKELEQYTEYDLSSFVELM